MSRGVNKCVLIGNLVADPDVGFTSESQTKVAKCRIAVNTKRRGVDHTLYRNVVFFGPLAEIADAYLKKGSQIYVEGPANDNSWEENGIQHFSTEVIGEQLNMLGGRPEGE